MPSRQLFAWTLVLFTAYGFAGCGDDGGGEGSPDGGSSPVRPGGGSGSPSGGGGSSSGGGGSGVRPPASVSGDKLLSELTEGEIVALCENLNEQLSEIVTDEALANFGCAFFALITAGEADSSGQLTVETAACEQAVDECLSAGGSGEVMETANCQPDNLTTAADGCSTTVDEFTACLDASVSQLESALGVFSCEGLSDPDVAAELLGTAMQDPTALPECATIAEECPALFETGGSVGEPAADGCDDSCAGNLNDGFCDDGGEGADFSLCPLGTDCADCGPR